MAYEPRRGFDYHADLQALCRIAGFEPVIVHQGSTTETVVGIVACGEGVAILPASARHLQMRGVTFHPLDVTDVPLRLRTVEFALAWHKDQRSPTVAEFVQQTAQGDLDIA